jgi:hypothetical protein
MSLAWNTEQLLSAPTSKGRSACTAVEYYFLSWRELYDKSILTVDRHHSSAGEWVVRGDHHFYTVTVTSRPVYRLPQQLCLSFDCFTKTVTKILSTAPQATSVVAGPPIDQVAFEFFSLLSVFAREPLLPLGIRRMDDRPITIPYHYSPPPRPIGATQPPAIGINSREFISVVKGLAQSQEANRNAALAASRLYYAALSLAGFDPAGAYVSLVCAMECLAGHHYAGEKFDFDEVEKFKPLKPTVAKVAKLSGGKALAKALKQQLVDSEYFLSQKFRKLIEEHLPESFWRIPDELYPYNSVFPTIKQSDLGGCLRDIYGARSSYVHAGKPFPPYIEFGLRDGSPLEVGSSIMELREKGRYLPPFSWFERVVHHVITEYLYRSFAPEVVRARDAELAEKVRLLAAIAKLPNNVTGALKKLTGWTARFLVYSGVIGPMAPNSEWADGAKTVERLLKSGLIDCEGRNMQGKSWLKDRFVGEVVGEYFFGIERNPFRGNELLDYKKP